MKRLEVRTYTQDIPTVDGFCWINEKVYEVVGTGAKRPSYKDECGTWILLSTLPADTQFCPVDKPEQPDKFRAIWNGGRDVQGTKWKASEFDAKHWFRMGQEAGR